MVRISGDDQQGLPGEPLANPFVVQVLDEEGDPFEGATVTFSVLVGGGTLSATTPTTDADGRAESLLTLGTALGTNKVQVSVEGISQRIVFSAEATTTPLEPMPVEEEMTPPVQESMPVETEEVMSSTPESTPDPEAETRISTPEPMPSLEFALSLPAGISLIHVPLKVRTVDGMATSIESVADLYDALGGAETLNWLITYDPESQNWRAYFGDADREAVANSVLTDQKGIIAGVKTPISVRLGGEPLGESGMTTIVLNSGLNLVGLPLKDPRLTRVSDLLGGEGSENSVYIILVADNGIFKMVGRAGDAGDIPITGGQAFLLFTGAAGTISITGTGWDNTDNR